MYVFFCIEVYFQKDTAVSHSKMELDVCHLLNTHRDEVLDDWHDKESYVAHHVSLLRQDFQ